MNLTEKTKKNLKADKAIATYFRLREEPLWRLLAADNGPAIIALLQAHLLDGEQRTMSASLFYDRIDRDLEALRIQGYELPQMAKAYVAGWLSQGWLVRRFPAGASEEVYELSLAATTAIRFVMGLEEPRATATESRLSGVIHQLIRLAEETETEAQNRIAALAGERDRIDREIEAIRQGKFDPLPDERALERVREIIMLAGDLAGDFRRVRDEFENLNRDLRQQLVNNEGSRGDVLDDLFTGVDIISDSDAGRTFYAFWRLLTDPEQSAVLDTTLEEVPSRRFAHALTTQERRFLSSITRILLAEGHTVHQVLQQFARSLKHFVQSREYLEQRRLHQVLREVQQQALALKESMKANDFLGYDLALTSSRMSSYSQWRLRDPSSHALTGRMSPGEANPIDLDSIRELIVQSEIDFSTLKANILFLLEDRSHTTISELIDHFPPSQGLGSIIGYMDLGIRCGVKIPAAYEIVAWQGQDYGKRQARIPTIYFRKEQADALVRA